MTCIVGIVDKKTKSVFIGADSAGVAGLDIVTRKDAKVFHNGEFIIGCTSSFRMIQLLQYSFEPPAMKTRDVHRYMCTDFIDAVRACFEKGGFLRKRESTTDVGGSFLVGYKSRLFSIDSDFQVGEVSNGIDAVGCGQPYALGSLYSSEGDPKERILTALKAAEFYSGGVRGPFRVLNT